MAASVREASEGRVAAATASAGITRRSFLVRAGAAGVALSAASWLAACRRDESGSTAAARPAHGSLIPPAERAVLVAFALRLVPGGPGWPSAEALGVPARIERELGFHDPGFARDVVDGLRLVEWWPVATRFTRFTKLSPDEQDAALQAMLESRFALVRSAFAGLKQLVLFFHYAQQPAWAGTGYDGPWVPRVRPPQSA